MKSIIGRKIGMTSVFAEDGSTYPVTVVEVLPNVVTQVKTLEKDGYEALQVGYEDKKEARANKAELGLAKKANTAPKYFYRELEGDEIYGKYEVGSQIECTLFQAGDMVDVTGLSKGHGYTGTIKRYHGHIGPKGHGSGYHRGVGSMGANSSPSRVFKNKHMPGHWGNEKTTVQNLEVVRVDKERGVLLIKGAIPGAKGALVFVKQSVKSK